MSIIPAYLSSFSSVVPHFRGTLERAEIDGMNRRENIRDSDKAQTTENENNEVSKRSAEALGVRSGDAVSSHGDVFSLSRDGKKVEKPAQDMNLKGDTAEELTAEEQQHVKELKQRDAEVKAHEAAHLGAAGGLALGGASYEYQKGPDGRNYAVGGEVSIDSSPVSGDPNATIVKARQIRSAALAPANPSSQDHKVATKASQMEVEARQELSKNHHNSQDSGSATDSHPIGDDEVNLGNSRSQYITNTAVTKYAAQSYTATSSMQSVFANYA